MSRPLFCTAIFRRMVSAETSALRIELQPFGNRPIPAIAGHQVAGDAPNRRDTDAGLFMDFAIRQSPLQQFHHRPPIGHRLQFGGRAQITEETAALIDRAQRQDGGAQRTLVLLLLPQGYQPVGFQSLEYRLRLCNALTRCYVNTLMSRTQAIGVLLDVPAAPAKIQRLI